MEFERLVDLVEPLGTVGRAAAAAFIERQFQLAQQAGDLLARGQVAHARTGAERRLVEVVERGETARKKFTIDHAFGEAFTKEALHKAGFSPRDIGRFPQLPLRREPDLMTESTLKKTNWPVFRSLASFRPSNLPGDLIAGLTT